ncbi:MAG TPA: DNA polymerase III subunit gamma/tau [Myxococcota bacterium]|nr:DNA polymerase III subunit gamma/tau [Myxococcota bacterium]
MSHLVLARKYRPKVFAQVVGQDGVVSALKSAIENNRVAHAMLFTGGRGIGKTTVARLLAKALVCLTRNKAEPCGECVQCKSVDNFSSLDVIEIDGASHTGVDDIRDLRDSARYQPTSAKRKIYIIDEVHMLSINAFNALLKILEEPPPHVMFIFATTEAHKIPKTILSRCQRYDFRRMSLDTIYATLKDIMKEERCRVDDEGLKLIASLADGGLRDALSLTEQILSHGHEHYSAAFVAQCFGVVSHAAVKEISRAVTEGQVEPALLLIREVYENGLDLCQLMDALAERFRALSLCAHIDKPKAAQIVPGVEEADFVYANSFDKADLKRLFAMALDSVAQVFSAHKPLHALELFVLRAALRPPIGDAVAINYCLQKLDAILHNRPLPADETLARPAPNSRPKDVTTLFRDFINLLSSEAPQLASHLRLARPETDYARHLLILHFEQSLHYEEALLNRENHHFKNACHQIFGPQFSIDFKLKQLSTVEALAIKTVAELEEDKQKQEKDALLAQAHNNPLVQKALEIFGGEITNIKRV